MYTKDNDFLGKLYLRGIQLAPKGVTRMEVTFKIDANSILSVYAKEIGTEQTASMVIGGGLS